MSIAAVLTTALVSVAAPPAQAGQRKQMIRSINHARAWSHRHRVGFSKRLSRGATSWARHLMRLNVLAHSSRAVQRGEGEIIEWHTGARAQIKQAVGAWLNSPGHRAVMLGHYRKAGAGRAVGDFDGQRCTIWVVRFA